jgi:LuxR family transcriptional regulator, maltose regulon positive regulatory protein
MVTSILATKLFIPPASPNYVLRQRLVDRLNQGLGRKLTLISAPAGFGKTTLVSEWANCCGHNEAPAFGELPVRTAWISLDDGDSDPVQFMGYLLAALRIVVPGLGGGIEEMLQSSQPSLESILVAVLNDVTTATSKIILVLDDYHVIDSRQVDEAITYLIDHLPPAMNLVITTREDPQLPLARLRARGLLTEMRAADLRFSSAEAAGFFEQMLDVRLSTEDITNLEFRTEGWIAGLQLAALAIREMPGRGDTASFIQSFSGTHVFVMDYLIEEVLQRQTESVQTFLLRTAILDRLCGPLCDAVLQTSPIYWQGTTGQRTLESLERSNLFIIPLDSERHWYRYHHLFADLLRQRLRQSQTPEEIAQYHFRAGQWLETNGDQAEAFRHFIAARDYDRAAAVAERSWQGMHNSFQSALWLGWVKQLPEEIICSRPVLCVQIAWGLMDAHEVDASESRLRDAERCLEDSSDGMVIVDQEQFRSLRARIAFARAYNAQTRRDFLSAIEFAEAAYQLTPEENQVLRAQTTAILGATYLVNGDLDAACQSMNDWIDRSMKVGNYFSAFAYAMAEKADIQVAQGHLREALRTYQQSLELAAEHDSGVLRVMAHQYLGMAMLFHEMGDDLAADKHLQKSLDLSGLHRSVDWSYRRCVAQARLKESAGELEAALDLLDEAKRFYIKTLIPHTRPIDAIKARIYLKQGRLFKAEAWVNEQGLDTDDELIYLHEYEHIILARVLLAEYQANQDERAILNALNLLERLIKAAEDRCRMGSVLEILVTQALVYQGQGSTSRAFTSLERALVLAQPEGYVKIFIDEGDRMRSLLSDFRKAVKKQPRGGDDELMRYVDKLLSTFPLPKNMKPSKQIEPASLIEPLSQRELDVLSLFKTDLSGPEIAQELMVALSTVRTHTKSIYSKLNVTSRQAAVKRATELKLI